MPKLPELTAERVEAFLHGFLLSGLASPVTSPDFHFEMWQMTCSDHPKVAMAAPRSHAKSTAVTFTHSLASALFRRDPYVLVVSNTYGIATEFIRSIYETLTRNAKIRAVFKVDGFDMETQDDIIVRLQGGYRFRFKALGFGQSVRGVNWGTQRPTLVVVDDGEDDEMVASEDRRTKAENWFISALLPCVDPQRGRIRVVGTFLHMDALLTNLCDNPEWMSKVWEAHNDDFSEILWREMFSREKLLAIRRDYITRGKLDMYNCEYRNRVIDTTSGYFRADEFVPMTEKEKSKEFRKTLIPYAGGDFAWSTKEKRDFTVFPIVYTDHEFNVYVYFVLKRRMDSMETVDEMFGLQEAFDPLVWFNERGAISASLQAAVEMRTRQTGKTLNIQEMPVNKEKTIRARPFQAKMRQKMVKWNVDADWFPEVMQELLEFPKGKHDDVVDALAHIFIGLAEMPVPDTPEDEEEEEFRQREREIVVWGGREPVTGY